MKGIFFFFIICLLYLSCAERPDLSPIPSLKYIAPSKNIMKQGNLNQDTIYLTFEFEDGDGDIGFLEVNQRIPDLIITDKRTGNIYDNYILPKIPQQGTNNGIRGTMRVTLLTQCCKLNPCDPDENQPSEALPLEAYILDRAANKSNVVEIKDISLKCYY